MKKLFLPIFFSFIFAFTSNIAKASHAAGGELLYTWVSDSTYTFTFKFYRDCSGISEPTTVDMCYNNTCNAALNGTLTLNKISNFPNGQPNGGQVTTGCPGYPTQCTSTSSTTPGYEEWWYQGTLKLPVNCTSWTFFVSISARNTSINNIAAGNLYIEATLNSVYASTFAQNNSSPYFSNVPVPYICVNQQFSYNNGAVDPNSDSLVYTSIQPRTSSGSCTSPSVSTLAYTPPASTPGIYNQLNNPFNTNYSYYVLANLGNVVFTPASTQIAVISILVTEYRGGIKIGSVMRDIQIIVGNCNSPSPVQTVVPSSISGAAIDPITGYIKACANDTVTFCFWLTSTNPAAILVATSNNAVSLPGSTLTYSGLQTDSILACINWHTGLGDTGLHVLTITVKDSTCAPPGFLVQNTFAIPIYVNPITKAFKDSTICKGDTVHLLAVGGSSFIWTALPGGSGNASLSCLNCANPVASPQVTTSYAVKSDIDTICNSGRDTVKITVLQAPKVNIGPDFTMCENATHQLNATVTPAGNYNFSWSPAVYLSNPSIPNPSINYPLSAAVNYTLTATPSAGAQCPGRDTVQVTILNGFNIINNDTAICAGQTVDIITLGSNLYTYTWTPNTNVSNPTIKSPQISPTDSTLYTLTATYPNCPDSVQTIFIGVEQVPIVNAGIDRQVCKGDTIHLLGSVTPPYFGNNGNGYVYNWTSNANINDGTILDPIFSGLTTETLSFTATTQLGCADTDNVVITVNPSKFLTVSADTSICPLDTISLFATGAVSYLWHPTAWLNDSISPNILAYPIATTDYKIYGKNINGCIDSAKINVFVSAAAVVDAGQDVTIYPGQTAQLNASGNCSFFTWSPSFGLNNTNIQDPITSPSVSQQYIIEAWTMFGNQFTTNMDTFRLKHKGCIAKDTVLVTVVNESILAMPNAFSPGDNTTVNDQFKLDRLGIVKINSFKIFDRWGKIVFETTDFNKGWDGKYNDKPQPIGTYVYTLDALTGEGKVIKRNGNITLIR